MKLAKVTIIFKGSDKNLTTNYRPISVLPIFSKGLETIIMKRLNSFFAKHSVLTNHQFGFRKGKTANTVLLLQKEIILNNIENKLLTLAFLLISIRLSTASTTIFC